MWKKSFNYHLHMLLQWRMNSMNQQELLGHLLLATGKVVYFRILQEYLSEKKIYSWRILIGISVGKATSLSIDFPNLLGPFVTPIICPWISNAKKSKNSRKFWIHFVWKQMVKTKLVVWWFDVTNKILIVFFSYHFSNKQWNPWHWYLSQLSSYYWL